MTTLLAFLITIAVLVVFHELGHYWVARLAGVRILRFSVGFGQVLARRTDARGTEWALSAIPLGGYVKMLDEREGDVPADLLPQSFNRQSLGARAAIVAAGPVANFLLAIALFWALFMVGVPASKPILGSPPPDTQAAAAGITPGMTVTAVAGETPQSWQDLHWLVLKALLRDQAVTLETRDEKGYIATHQLLGDATDESMEKSPLSSLGLVQALPPLPPVLGSVMPDSPAANAGLQTGDRILSVDGLAVETWQALVEYVRKSPGQPIQLLLERNSVQTSVDLTPEAIEEGKRTIGRIGAAPQVDEALLAPYRTLVREGPIDALGHALQRTWELSAFSLEMLGRMVMGQASLKNLSGPITIADYAGQSAQSGLTSFVAFLALVSISLGVLNLLPVPLLDGGHLLYYFAEFVTGRPVSEKTQEIGQKIGLLLLGTLMFFAMYNDLERLFAR
ncbi:MAG: RIP metalloprotease RseP [Pseudomonadota bacterium]